MRNLALMLTAAMALALISLAASPAPRQPASSPSTASAPALTDQQMLAAATQAVAQDYPKAVVTAARSKNVHLGEWPMPTLSNVSFYCTVTGHTPAAPRRYYLSVSRTGQVVVPFDVAKYPDLLAAEDKSKWKDEDYLSAAVLWVHLMSPANEDGWKLLKKPEDFTAITFNMPAAGPAAAKRQEAAKQIEAPKIERKDDQVTVTFHAWHLIGGSLRQWTVQIGPKAEAAKKELGRFGGGGYD
jgi:hypothetical protein